MHFSRLWTHNAHPLPVLDSGPGSRLVMLSTKKRHLRDQWESLCSIIDCLTGNRATGRRLLRAQEAWYDES